MPGIQVARGGGYAAAILTLGWLLWPCLQTSQKLVEMDDPKHMKQIIQMCCQGVKEVSIARMEEMKLLACLTSLGSDTTTLVQRSSPRSPHFLYIYGVTECRVYIQTLYICVLPSTGCWPWPMRICPSRDIMTVHPDGGKNTYWHVAWRCWSNRRLD